MSETIPQDPTRQESTVRQSFAEIETGIGDLLGASGKVVLGAFGIFVLWAAFVPMESAVVAPGTVIGSGQNKLVQHRGGGIVTAIHIRDGQAVRQGDVILELDPAIDRAELTKLRARRAVLMALKSRLEAEKRSANDLPLRREPDVTGAVVPTITPLTAGEARIVDEQEREFEKGRKLLAAELEALRQKGEGLRRQQNGAQKKLRLLDQQIAILQTQFDAATKLEKRGYIAKQQVWDIESRLLERRSEYSALLADSEAMSSSIEETRSNFRQAEFKDQRLTSEKLTEVLGELEQTSDQLKAAESAFAQTHLRAPVSGTLVRSTAVTVGGVIKPADTVGEIVPDGAKLEVEAKVQPRDIGAVHVGQPAKVQISALNARAFDPIPAEVVYVAADSTQDERTGERHFKVRVALRKEVRLADGAQGVGIGMTGEVYLQGEPRTFLSYIMRPFFESLARAFGEAT